MTEAEVRKTKGFSLMELMIALGILTLIATVAVPKVQVWNARNRGLQAVMEIISDFSKARSIAGYTVVGDNTSGVIKIPVKVNDSTGEPEGSGAMDIYLGLRLQTAIVFGLHEYSIYQKKDMENKTNSWQQSTLLKKNLFPDSVSIESVNGSTDSTTAFLGRLVFSSNGIVKGNLDEFPSMSLTNCGNVENFKANPLKQIVMRTVVKSKISDTDSIWYRIDIDKSGEYFVCTAFSATNQQYNESNDSIFTGADANPLNI